MLFLADENLNGDIVRGLLRRMRGIDLLWVQDAGLNNQPDEAILEWAAERRRITLTHDRATMVGIAARRVALGLPMAGLLVLDDRLPVRIAIEEILLIAECSDPTEWDGVVGFVPL
jgi:uncharacterized protein with PIN domain